MAQAWKALLKNNGASSPAPFSASPSTSAISHRYLPLSWTEPQDDTDIEMNEIAPTSRLGARFTDGEDTEKQDTSMMEKGSTLAPTSSNKSSDYYANSTAGLDHKQENWKAERKLLFKLDILILPLAMMLYLRFVIQFCIMESCAETPNSIVPIWTVCGGPSISDLGIRTDFLLFITHQAATLVMPGLPAYKQTF